MICVFGLGILAVGIFSIITNMEHDVEHVDLSPYHEAKPDAFIIVNEHNGLSDWGLEQLDQLLDKHKE